METLITSATAIAVAIIGAAAGGSRSRRPFERDLEMAKKLDEAGMHKSAATVRMSIERRVRTLYSPYRTGSVAILKATMLLFTVTIMSVPLMELDHSQAKAALLISLGILVAGECAYIASGAIAARRP